MNNKVILIVIDSFNYQYIRDDEDFKNLCPFLYSLKDKCIKFSNVYSQGPFTESGVKSLLSGKNSLDDYNYIYRINKCPYTIFDFFRDEGYKTNIYYDPTYTFNNNLLNKFNSVTYINHYSFESFYHNKMDYLIKLLMNNKITERETNNLIEMFDYSFDSYLEYLDTTTNDYSLMEEYDNRLKNESDIINDEYKKYQTNKIKYIRNFEKTFVKTSLFKKRINYASETACNYQGDKKSKLVKLGKSFAYNNLFDTTILNGVRECENFSEVKSTLGYRYYHSFLSHRTLNQDRDILGSNLLRSTYTIFNHLANKVKDTKPEEKQFYYLHTEECHAIPTFITYDTDDATIIENDYNRAYEYAKYAKKSKKKGFLTYQLSLHYVDKQIEMLYHKLSERDDVDFIITADHGSSISEYPTRKNTVHNMHIENYSIPLFKSSNM